MREEPSETRKTLKIGIRVALSAALLYFAYHSVDSNKVVEILSSLSLSTFALILLIYLFSQTMSVWKWRVLFTSNGIDRPFFVALQAYYFGMFLNVFGLGTLGGDLFRSMALRPGSGLRANALASVVADRVHGLLVLGAIGAIASIVIQPEVFGDLGILFAAIYLLLAAIVWFAGPRVLEKLFSNSDRFSSIVARISAGFPKNKSTLLYITAISLAFHFLQICCIYLIIQDLKAPISFAYLLATLPFATILSTLPISVNGLGIREWAYVVMFAAVGADTELCLALAAIWVIVITLVGAFAGAAVVLVAKKPKELQSADNKV